MIKEQEIVLSPQEAQNEQQLAQLIARKFGVKPSDLNHFQILKRSLDARSKNILMRMRVQVFTHEDAAPTPTPPPAYKEVHNAPRVIIVGTGPAGLFAALTLLERGFKPIILERGKNIHERKLDLANLNRNQNLNLESNYCFGEGGAGTFSDGKLYTRSNKRGNVQDVLNKFVYHGANSSIRMDAHAHIGSDRLPVIIENMRNRILDCGGEILFNTRVDDLIVKDQNVLGVIDHNGNKHEGIATILATGHSAKNIYELFHKNNWALESKPFALGVRAEHPQVLIDRIQYKHAPRHSYLPAAEYSLVTQVGDRGVFSFCMCPGGIIVPAATENNQMVVNGMSNSMRNSPFANSGIVVTVNEKDYAPYAKHGALAGLHFQSDIEEKMFNACGYQQIAPAQRLHDFVNGKMSQSLPKTSYHPGVRSAPLHELLPDFVTKSLQRGFIDFNIKMQGFQTNEALLLGVESRTSSPVRIPRGEDLQHIQLKNLYPCGEGAGYAGGIVSSALDGINAANAIQ